METSRSAWLRGVQDVQSKADVWTVPFSQQTSPCFVIIGAVTAAVRCGQIVIFTEQISP